MQDQVRPPSPPTWPEEVSVHVCSHKRCQDLWRLSDVGTHVGIPGCIYIKRDVSSLGRLQFTNAHSPRVPGKRRSRHAFRLEDVGVLQGLWNTDFDASLSQVLSKTSRCCLQMSKPFWRDVQLGEGLRTPSGGSVPAFRVQSTLRLFPDLGRALTSCLSVCWCRRCWCLWLKDSLGRLYRMGGNAQPASGGQKQLHPEQWMEFAYIFLSKPRSSGLEPLEMFPRLGSPFTHTSAWCCLAGLSLSLEPCWDPLSAVGFPMGLVPPLPVQLPARRWVHGPALRQDIGPVPGPRSRAVLQPARPP